MNRADAKTFHDAVVETCDRCNGSGRIETPSKNWILCGKCGGHGRVFCDELDTLLRMIARYFKDA